MENRNFKEFIHSYDAIFTADSNQLLMKKEDALYLVDLDGSSKKISDFKPNLRLYSVEQNYYLKSINPNGIYLTDVHGIKNIKITPDSASNFLEPVFSTDGKTMFSTFIKNDKYTSIRINLTTLERQTIMTDNLEHSIIGYDEKNNLIFWRLKDNQYEICSKSSEGDNIKVIDYGLKAKISINGCGMIYAKSHEVCYYQFSNEKKTFYEWESKPVKWNLSIDKLGNSVLLLANDKLSQIEIGRPESIFSIIKNCTYARFLLMDDGYMQLIIKMLRKRTP